METSLTPYSLATLFAAMVVLAAVPSASVFAVMARSAAHGFAHGLYTTLGIVAGDILFILLAVFGLAMLADALDGLFSLLKHAGAAYLIALGILTWRATPKTSTSDASTDSPSRVSSVLAGLAITLGDQKAILFYLGFFPAFTDLETITPADAALLIATAGTALLGTKLVYAGFATRAGLQLGPRAGRWLNRLAGGVMITVGVCLVTLR